MARIKTILGMGAVFATLLMPALVSAQAPVPPEEPRPPVLQGPVAKCGKCPVPWPLGPHL